MKANMFSIIIAILCIPFHLLANEQNSMSSANYQEVVGEYEVYIDMQSVYAKISVYEENNKFFAKSQILNASVELHPIDIKNYVFSAQLNKDNYTITFYKDSATDVLETFTLIVNEKHSYTGIRLHPNSHKNIGKQKFPIDTLKKELQQIYTLLIEHHSNVYKFTNKNEFKLKYEEQLSQINYPMTIGEFFRIAMPLVELVHCGHTNLEMPDEFWTGLNNNAFPLKLYFIDNKAFIADNITKKTNMPIGAEVLAINDIPISTFLDSAYYFISADGQNTTFKRAMLPYIFSDLFTILYGGQEKFKIQFQELGHLESKEFFIMPIERKAPYELIQKYSTPDFNLEIDKDKNTAILTIHDFNFYNTPNPCIRFIDSAFAEIKKSHVENLILDLRNNIGGDPLNAAHLLSYIEKKPVAYFKKVKVKPYAPLFKTIPLAENHFEGNVYALINGQCFSTAGHLCSLLKYHTFATLIGEQTGGSYQSNGGIVSYNTRQTRFSLPIAQMTFTAVTKDLPEDNGIVPDYEVIPSAEDIKNKIDPEMEHAFKLIQKENL